MGFKSHKKNAPIQIDMGIITASTSRTITEDKSGQWIRDQAIQLGHQVKFHKVIPDDSDIILDTVRSSIDEFKPHIILMTGGTGISSQDVTIETIRPLFKKELTGFGALFAQLSFEEIGSPALLSRATAGVINQTILFCMPGSLGACQLACKMLIFPEVGHLVKHVLHN